MMTDAKILLVDDEPLVTEELQEVLEDEGYSVVTACCVADALAHPELSGVDVIVTDLKMPGAGGLELLRAVKDNPELSPKIFVVSGHGAESNRTEAIALGAIECFSKPIDVDDLIQAIEDVCE